MVRFPLKVGVVDYWLLLVSIFTVIDCSAFGRICVSDRAGSSTAADMRGLSSTQSLIQYLH